MVKNSAAFTLEDTYNTFSMLHLQASQGQHSAVSSEMLCFMEELFSCQRLLSS